MKKILTAAAMALLLLGCAKQADDHSGILEKLAELDNRVTLLEGSIASLQSAVGEGVFVQKVEEYVDPGTGKTVGITVTYTSGRVVYFEIKPKDDYAGPVIGVIQNGAGQLVWAVDGIAIQLDGEYVPVNKTPVFSIDGDGNLIVTVDGEQTNLGPVKSEGATLQDGIFTDLAVTDSAVVLTLSDGSTVNIPFAEAFQLVIEQTEFTFSEPAPVEIPYTVTAKTANTVVGAYYDMDKFSVAVEANKVVVTPFTAKSSGMIMLYADSKVGLTSIVTVTVEAEGFRIVDTPYSATVDYLAPGEDAVVNANAVSNIAFDVKPQADWIHLVSVKSTAYVITLKLDDNRTGAVREGVVNVVKAGTEDVIQTIVIAQENAPAGTVNLSKNGTANSYIVTEAGEYKFKAVKGNTEESVGTVASAELLWETWNNQESVTKNSVIASVAVDGDFITFTTPETFHAGNALIAAKDASGAILWSWHIWLPATPVTDVADADYSVKNAMSRNLGALVDATIDTPTTVESFGLLYEWGRKDPFPGLGVLSGAGAITIAGEVSYQEGPMSVEDAIKNPAVYVYMPKGDWAAEGTDTATLWGETAKTVYDPCPVGYMLPQRNKSCAFWSGTKWTESTPPFVLNQENCAFSVGTLVFPLAGYIDDGGEGQKKAGTRTIVWSGRWDSGTVNGYGFYGYTDDGVAFRNQGNVRSRGGSVRCVAEE